MLRRYRIKMKPENNAHAGHHLFCRHLTSIATVVPVMFDSREVQYQVDGQTKTRKVVDPHSFSH